MEKTRMGQVSINMEALIKMIETKTPSEGMQETPIPEVVLFRESLQHPLEPLLYDPFFIFIAQGKKQGILENTRYEYDSGHFLTVLAPVPMACQVIEASKEKPLLAIGILINRARIRNMLMKIDQVEPAPAKPVEVNPSGIFTAPLNEALLNALIRLMKTMDSPAEAAIVGEAVVEEIYFRILKYEQGGALPFLLHRWGQIEQITNAVEYIHRNLSEVISVDKLSALANMSSAAFHKKFKEVMHMSPLQYAKQIKLIKAQTFILSGMKVSEAGYKVGYNSPAQFSREYKRHFGIAPSIDRMADLKSRSSEIIEYAAGEFATE
jgi:AraC-like DNA-binding protein